MIVTEKFYNKVKPLLKTPADDKRAMKRFYISARTARKIRCTKDWAEYQAENSAKRAKARQKVVDHSQEDLDLMDKLNESASKQAALEKENADLLKQRNWQFTQGYLLGLATGIVVTIIGVIIAIGISNG